MRNKIKNPNVMFTPLFLVRPLIVDNHRTTLFVAIVSEISFILVCKTTTPQCVTTPPPHMTTSHHKSTLSNFGPFIGDTKEAFPPYNCPSNQTILSPL